jgi:hypothetical protein
MSVKSVFLTLPLILAGAAGPAFAWGTDSTPRDPSVAAQFTDPDAAVDNIANGSTGGGTALSAQSNGTGNTHAVTLPAATATDAEPANPGWPLWMTWHQ